MKGLRPTCRILLGAWFLTGGLAGSADADLRIFAFASLAKAAEPETPGQSVDESAAPPPAEPHEITRRLDLAYGNLSRGRYEEALTLFRGVLKLDSTDRRARFGLGNVMIQMEQYAEAQEIFESLVADFPDDFSFKNNLSWLYATAKDHRVRNGARALELAQDALLLAPNSFNTWSTLAEAYYILGQYNRAERAAQIALDMASAQKGTERNVQEYRRQVDKCRRAAEAMSIIE